MRTLFEFLVFFLATGVLVVIFKKLADTPIKEGGPQKNGNRHWDKYIDRTKAKTYQKGTKKGKMAVKAFIDALDMRVAGDEHDRYHAKDIYMKHMMYHWHFYKWLAEYIGFDPEANPRNNVPILTTYKTENGKFRFIANVIGHKAHQQFELEKHLEDSKTDMRRVRYKTLKTRIKGQVN